MLCPREFQTRGRRPPRAAVGPQRRGPRAGRSGRRGQQDDRPDTAAAQVVAQRLRAKGWAGVVYTSHNHQRGTDIRLRVVLPLPEEIDQNYPPAKR